MPAGNDNILSETSRKQPKLLEIYLVLALLSIGLFWVYWPTIGELVRQWTTNSQYSHGFLVPVFALVLLWLRRDKLQDVSLGFYWWGIGLLLVGAALRLAATWVFFDWLDAFSLLPCVAGIIVLLMGRKGLAWSWPAIVFLVFMIPLPFRLHIALGFPLQRIATIASTYLLQLFGLPALAEGNTILLNEHHLGVVEACNGLSMLMVFFALSTAVVLVIQRPLWERLILLASAIPIAIASNVIRITVTGILYETAGSEVANFVFHDLAGWLMMPLALGFLWLELKMLSMLFIEVKETKYQHVSSTEPTNKSEPPTTKKAPVKPAKTKKKAGTLAAAKAGLADTKQ